MNRISRDIGLISIFTALSVVGRIYLVIIPNVSPVAPLSLLAGYLNGYLSGFLVGFLSMFISDLFIGVGPWTIFTSLFMGIVGVFGWFIKRFSRDKTTAFILSFTAVMLYDIGTSIFPMIFFGVPPLIAILNLFLPVFILGIPYPMGPIHEISSSLLFILLYSYIARYGLDRGVIYG